MMNLSMKRAIVAVLAAVTLLVGGIVHYKTLLYLRDCATGLYIEAAETLFPHGSTFTMIDHRTYRPHIRTYRALPQGFVYAGGIFMYRAGADTDLSDVAQAAVPFTGYLRASRLAAAIRDYNGFSGSDIPKGAAIFIPGPAPALNPDTRNRVMPGIITARGLYFTAMSVGNGRILKNLDRYRELGINTIVFDIKDISGDLTHYSRVPEAREYGTDDRRVIDNMATFIATLKQNGFYTVARIAVFHDRLLRKRDPKLAIRSRGGGAWNPGGKEKWCDPTNKKVQDYNINLAAELADMGADEIQFDYIRFPTTGNLADADFAYSFGRMSNDAAITQFLKRAHEKIAARNARLSIDIFGVVAWGKAIDIRSTGQRIELLARHCDIISPMLYPSHFNDDFDGYAKPGDNPYYFIYNGCKKVIALAGSHAIVRPWLQAFRWRVSNYNRNYILTQIKATNESGANGWLFWNASNDYDTVLNALKDLKYAKISRKE